MLHSVILLQSIKLRSAASFRNPFVERPENYLDQRRLHNEEHPLLNAPLTLRVIALRH